MSMQFLVTVKLPAQYTQLWHHMNNKYGMEDAKKLSKLPLLSRQMPSFYCKMALAAGMSVAHTD